MNIEQEQEDFRCWLGQMSAVLDRFRARFPEQDRAHLDLSPASLDFLENWLLKRYPTAQAFRSPDEKQVWDEVGRYIGETYLKELGGYWEIRLDNPKYAYYGVPQITGFSKRPTPECPHFLSVTAVDRRTGNFLKTLLAKMKIQEAKWK